MCGILAWLRLCAARPVTTDSDSDDDLRAKAADPGQPHRLKTPVLPGHGGLSVGAVGAVGEARQNDVDGGDDATGSGADCKGANGNVVADQQADQKDGVMWVKYTVRYEQKPESGLEYVGWLKPGVRPFERKSFPLRRGDAVLVGWTRNISGTPVRPYVCVWPRYGLAAVWTLMHVES